MLFGAFLALCHAVLAIESKVDPLAVNDAALAESIIPNAIVSTITHSSAVYVLAASLTAPISDELAVVKRDAVLGVDDQIEATIVIDTVPSALPGILSAEGSTTTAAPDNGVYGNAGDAGSGPVNGPGTSVGSTPSSGPGNGTSLPSLPSGAYGQPPNTAGQQSPSSTGGQLPNPFGQQSPSPTGVASPISAGPQSPNPTGLQPPKLITTILPVIGTEVETITIDLETAPSSRPLSTPTTSDTGIWGPLSASTTQPLPTTFVTIYATTTLSTPCQSATAPWGLLSASNAPLSTTFVTIPGAGSSTPISTVSSAPSIVVVTVPGSQGSLSGPVSTGDPTVTSWETEPGTIVTKSLQTGSGAAGPQLSSTTCTTDIFTNVISASKASSAITTAATMAAGSGSPTTLSLKSSVTVQSTVTPVPDVNAGVHTAEFSLTMVCGLITLTLLASITTMI